MSDQLKRGDRVRVTDRNRVQGYQAGEKGMVQTLANILAIGDQLHYEVAIRVVLASIASRVHGYGS
ncbi:MAG TPA: hypothetical protein VMG10_31900 [Gemmataceae bacterium]|nr:hypothetical protein [Gemmataceae bacterium]